MIATARRAIVHRITGNAFVDFVRENEGLNIGRAGIAPRAGVGSPSSTGGGTVTEGGVAEIEVATVVTLPEPTAYRVDAGKEAVATHTHLPLHRTRGTAEKCHSTRAVILRTTVCLRVGGGREIGADIAGVELDCVQAGVHVHPRWFNASSGSVGVGGGVNAAVTAG